MIAGLLAGVLATQDPAIESKLWYLGDPEDKITRIGFFARETKLPASKQSPKLFGDPPQPFSFDWVMAGLARPNPAATTQFDARFRVYSQSQKTHTELAPSVTRLLMRCWDYAITKLNIDHSRDINARIVDVYLCYGGTPGGEQMFADDVENDRHKTVNTIYIYDLPSFKMPVEMAREVCHEYGHAVLWPISGYRVPEDWANGVFGEKVFMKWLAEESKAKRLTPEDCMGASAADLMAWVKANVTPSIDSAAENGPSTLLEDGIEKGAMDASAGLIQYMLEILPYSAFAQGVKLACVPNAKAKDLAPAFVEAVRNREGVVLEISAERRKKPFWVPLDVKSGSLRNGRILERRGNWAKVTLGAGVLTLVHKL